jgi:hypothetical protein
MNPDPAVFVPAAAAATKSALCLSRCKGVRMKRGSGTEPLAPARTPGSDDLAAGLGRHPRSEAVPPLAHQLARLIGPFHGSFSAADARRNRVMQRRHFKSRDVAKPLDLPA